jgi:hypothetical protein
MGNNIHMWPLEKASANLIFNIQTFTAYLQYLSLSQTSILPVLQISKQLLDRVDAIFNHLYETAWQVPSPAEPLISTESDLASNHVLSPASHSTS